MSEERVKRAVAAFTEALAVEDEQAAAALMADGRQPAWLRQQVLTAVLPGETDGILARVFSRIFAAETELPSTLLALYLRRESDTLLPQRRAAHLAALARVCAAPVPSPEVADAALTAIYRRTFLPMPLGDWGVLSQSFTHIFIQLLPPGFRGVPDIKLFRAARALSDFDALRRLVQACGPNAPAEVFDQAVQAVALLCRHDERQVLEKIAWQHHQRDPGNARVVMNLATILQANGEKLASIAPLFDGLAATPEDATWRQAITWIARRCRDDGNGQKAADYEALLRSAKVEEGGGQAVQFDTALPSDLVDLLGQAVTLAQRDMSFDAADDAEGLRRDFGEIAAAVAALDIAADTPASAVFLAAAQIRHHGARLFNAFRLLLDPDSGGFVGKQYGILDPVRLEASYHGMMAVGAAVSSLPLKALQAGAPLRATLDLVRLLELRASFLLDEGEDERLSAEMRDLAAHGVVLRVIDRLVIRCRLAGPVAAAARDTLAPGDGPLLPLIKASDWAGAEGLTWSVLCDDAPIASTFEVVWPGGGLERFAHRTLANRILACPAQGVTLIDGGIVIGRGGHVLANWKLRSNPAGHPINRYLQALGSRGLQLRLPMRPSMVRDPVVLLGDLDAAYEANFYHWFIDLLSRINLLRRRGHLAGRKLIVPAGLPRWAKASLDLVGLGNNDLFEVPAGRNHSFADVLVVAPGYGARTLLADLRNTILAATGVTAGTGDYLYVSRRNNSRRSLVNEADVEAAAEAAGFRVVCPEDHSLAEQARMFHQARGVVATEGAALTNLIYCQPGIRMVGLVNQNDMSPVFNDLCAYMGLEHRKAPGVAIPEAGGVNYIWSPYEIDAASLAPHFDWVKEKG